MWDETYGFVIIHFVPEQIVRFLQQRLRMTSTINYADYKRSCPKHSQAMCKQAAPLRL